MAIIKFRLNKQFVITISSQFDGRENNRVSDPVMKELNPQTLSFADPKHVEPPKFKKKFIQRSM